MHFVSSLQPYPLTNLDVYHVLCYVCGVDYIDNDILIFHPVIDCSDRSRSFTGQVVYFILSVFLSLLPVNFYQCLLLTLTI